MGDEAAKHAIIKILEDETRIFPKHPNATKAMKLAIQAEQYTKEVEIPPEYKQFTKLFNKEESQCFPPSRVWDYAIKLTKDTPKSLDCKVYPLNQEDDKSLQTWIDKQVAKG